MNKPAVLILMGLVILGQIPIFICAMKNRQTARAWFVGFVIALLIGCWIVCFVHADV